VGVSTQHLRKIADLGMDVAAEVEGILAHELTHGYQNSHAAPPSWLIEGIADSVRIKAGLHLLRTVKPGGHWTDSYTTTAFFFVWLDDRYPGFLHRLNLMLREGSAPWTEAAFSELTGFEVATLWDDFQASIGVNG
jgi:hypothetical protein